MSAPPVTNHERARMRRMRELRMSIGEIALEVNRTERCVWDHVNDMPVRVQHGIKPWPDAKIARFLAAYAAGAPAEDLGPRFGIAPISVRPTACNLRRRLREARP